MSETRGWKVPDSSRPVVHCSENLPLLQSRASERDSERSPAPAARADPSCPLWGGGRGCGRQVRASAPHPHPAFPTVSRSPGNCGCPVPFQCWAPAPARPPGRSRPLWAGAWEGGTPAPVLRRLRGRGACGRTSQQVRAKVRRAAGRRSASRLDVLSSERTLLGTSRPRGRPVARSSSLPHGLHLSPGPVH